MICYKIYWSECNGPIFRTAEEALTEALNTLRYDLEDEAGGRFENTTGTVRIEEVEMTEEEFAAMAKISKQYGVGLSAIYNIAKGNRWTGGDKCIKQKEKEGK